MFSYATHRNTMETNYSLAFLTLLTFALYGGSYQIIAAFIFETQRNLNSQLTV